MRHRIIEDLNRRSWESAASRHNVHKAGAADFFKSGGIVFTPFEVEFLGSVRHQEILQPMCNDGREAFSLANLGASVVGVDFSLVATDWARRLGAELDLSVTFYTDEILNWFSRNPAARTCDFDGVYVSRGSLWWLSRLEEFFVGAFESLRPGGWLAILEFHPLLLHLDEDLRLRPWGMAGSHHCWVGGVEDYVGENRGTLLPWQDANRANAAVWQNASSAVTFEWNLSDVVSSVVGAGFTIERMAEHPFVVGEQVLSAMERDPNGLYWLRPSFGAIPLMYSLKARRT